ncbi:MAG: cell division protein ZapB [Nostoc sp.]|uniref:cell division protein ZapB n=1 Tax=Nostoc sp. TaxID=1180 RepID=UPI002FF1232C
MRTTIGSVHRNSPIPTTQAYPPSVPLSVYRELSTELQAAQARLNALTTQNQQLAQENQLLRQEITKVVESFSRLQNFVDSHTTPGYHQATQASGDFQSAAKQPIAPARPRQEVSRSRPSVVPKTPREKSRRQDFPTPVTEMNFPIPEPVFIEEQQVSYYYSTTEPDAKGINSWWLIITILLIMLTAFSAGYFVVRPLFEHQKR